VVGEVAPTPHASGTETGHRRLRLVLIVAAIVTALDQLTKIWAVATLSDRDIDIVGSLRFHLERNSGAAFSFASGRGALIAVLALAVVGGLLWFSRTADTAIGAVALGFVLGGAVGNLVDRFARDGSAVVDFIDAQWWPVFNVADIGVSVGAVLLLITSWRADAGSE
jgi:signal peptidase II